jgi:hypothetical protein
MVSKNREYDKIFNQKSGSQNVVSLWNDEKSLAISP